MTTGGNSFYNLTYLASTNEIIGRSGARSIFKFNLTTTDTASIQLAGSSTVEFKEIVTDNKSNLYGYKYDYTAPNKYVLSIVKLNPVTGTKTLVTDLSSHSLLGKFTFVPAHNELCSVFQYASGGWSVYKYNLATNKNSEVSLTHMSNTTYYGLTSN